MEDKFGADFNTDYFKKLIHKDEYKGEEVIENAEIIEVPSESSNKTEYLNEHTTQGLPKISLLGPAGENAQQIQDEHPEESQEIQEAFSRMFESLNKQYGLTVKFSYDTFADTLLSMVKQTDMRVRELYTSEVFSRARVMLYEKYIQSILILSHQLLDPKYITSESLTWKDRMEIVRELFGFMTQIEDIYEKVKVENASSKLEQLKEDQGPQFSLDNPEVKDFLENFATAIKNKTRQLSANK